ncbi:MFS hexose transporter [Aspergillus steynii IBT 23096]|uniref:MFS hexose transporter n=1 Tax=Aspergillus steynii IBT 23096 TaxID=1392250 RepID=A0A2I2FW00_9EURO|nr:MFS hexose transporter [Aspergillus steynii IBT 23096]PLB44794.1 MFS hexose transporter [Aspergillus steynii IBT 23096]
MPITADKSVDRQALENTTLTTNKQGPWWKDAGLCKLNFMLFFLMFSEFTQGYDASLINNVQQLKVWQNDFNHPHGSLLGAMSAMYWIGNIVGVVFISSVSDRLGRRWCLLFGAILCLAGTGLATGASNAGLFIAGRLLLGLGGVVVAAIGPVWMGELAYPDHRATATAMSNTTYSAGAILSAWVTFGSFRMTSAWAWRIPTVFQALPSVIQAIGSFILPESPRWLISKGREDAALQILVKYHGNGNPDDPVVQFEFQEMKETIELEIAANNTSWSALFNSRGNRWRSFILVWCGVCKQWSGNGLVSYYLGSMLKSAGITREIETTLITATSQMFSFACSLAFAFLPGRVGRRPLLLWSMALMWVVFALITACTGVYVETDSQPASYATVAFIYLYSGVHNIGWTGAMMLYVVEILPYSMRSKGIALFWLVTGATGAFNTYVNPIGIDAFAWKYYFFYVGWIIVQFVVVYLFFIETKGPSLEQIALLFDGKDAVVGHVNPVAEEFLDEKRTGEGKMETREIEVAR